MSPRLPLEELGATKSERRLLRRLGVVLVAVVLGAGGGITAYARVSGVERKIDNHLREVKDAGRYMVRFAEWSVKTQHALCKASPDADCPGPPVWPGPGEGAER